MKLAILDVHGEVVYIWPVAKLARAAIRAGLRTPATLLGFHRDKDAADFERRLVAALDEMFAELAAK